jgi:hypothetical protein
LDGIAINDKKNRIQRKFLAGFNSHAVYVNRGSFDGFVLFAATFKDCIFHFASPIFTSP